MPSQQTTPRTTTTHPVVNHCLPPRPTWQPSAVPLVRSSLLLLHRTSFPDALSLDTPHCSHSGKAPPVVFEAVGRGQVSLRAPHASTQSHPQLPGQGLEEMALPTSWASRPALGLQDTANQGQEPRMQGAVWHQVACPGKSEGCQSDAPPLLWSSPDQSSEDESEQAVEPHALGAGQLDSSLKIPSASGAVTRQHSVRWHQPDRGAPTQLLDDEMLSSHLLSQTKSQDRLGAVMPSSGELRIVQSLGQHAVGRLALGAPLSLAQHLALGSQSANLTHSAKTPDTLSQAGFSEAGIADVDGEHNLDGLHLLLLKLRQQRLARLASQDPGSSDASLAAATAELAEAQSRARLQRRKQQLIAAQQAASAAAAGPVDPVLSSQRRSVSMSRCMSLIRSTNNRRESSAGVADSRLITPSTSTKSVRAPAPRKSRGGSCAAADLSSTCQPLGSSSLLARCVAATSPRVSGAGGDRAFNRELSRQSGSSRNSKRSRVARHLASFKARHQADEAEDAGHKRPVSSRPEAADPCTSRSLLSPSGEAAGQKAAGEASSPCATPCGATAGKTPAARVERHDDVIVAGIPDTPRKFLADI
ncbi:hypothetical protein V8C86DRAFT_2781471 [Haematococcus lacustris]